MPARSESQREYLNARFGHAWTKRHHFDNRGRLPAHTMKGKQMAQDKRGQLISAFMKKRKPPRPDVGPTGDSRRPYQQFVGVGGKQASAPAGSGPLNPVRPKSKYYLGKGAAKYSKGDGRPD